MKVLVSGLGLVSAAGLDARATLETFRRAERRPGPVTLFKSEIHSPVFEAVGFSSHFFSERLRTLNLCLAALEEALADAGLKNSLKGKRVGVALGTTVGSILNDLDFYGEYRRNGKASMDAVDRYLQSNMASAVHSFLKTEGPSATVVNACASGADAVGTALSWLRAGFCDIAIAGGADEMNRVPLCGFHSLGILSEVPCAPFDGKRSGLNLGEGAGVLILESAEHLKKRGGKVRAAVAGYGTSNDAYHLTSPDPQGQGLERAISGALRDAGIKPADISFINAHGTATRENDFVEGLVLNRMFGPKVPFLSTKGYTGHTLGAAGGLEAGFAILGLENGWIPPSAGFVSQDPEISLSPVSKQTPVAGRYALSTSLGFGGCDAALILERVEAGGIS